MSSGVILVCYGQKLNLHKNIYFRPEFCISASAFSSSRCKTWGIQYCCLRVVLALFTFYSFPTQVFGYMNKYCNLKF